MRDTEALARESREWLGKAAEDLGSCRALIASGHVGNALFFCQQAAEKSLKAFLTWHDRTFRRTHDIEELGAACGAIDSALSPLLEEADILSDYAWKLRYPGAAYTPDTEEVEAMSAIAWKVFREVQSRLPPEARTTVDSGNQE